MWLISLHDMVCYVKPKIIYGDFWDRIYFILPVISLKNVPKDPFLFFLRQQFTNTIWTKGQLQLQSENTDPGSNSNISWSGSSHHGLLFLCGGFLFPQWAKFLL